MHIRQETPTDASAIARTVERAFAGHPHSVGNEVAIICGLRTAKALSVSLVADVNGRVRGYVAASPVQVAGRPSSWFGLGPVAVDPAVQRQGIGGVLVSECLDRLRSAGASGCVVLGDPAYYGRFGFEAHTGLSYKGAPAEYFLALSFGAPIPQGEVSYHAAFDREA